MRPVALLVSMLPILGFAFVVAAADVAQSDAPVTVELRPHTAEASKEYPLTLSFTGKIYPPGWTIADENDQRLQAPSDRFVAHAVSVNRNGSAEDLLSLWQPSERSGIASMVSDNALFSKNQAVYKQIKETEFLTRMRYGQYVVFLVQHSGPAVAKFVKTYVIKEVAGKYFLTNDLKDDLAVQFLVRGYGQGLLHERQ